MFGVYVLYHCPFLSITCIEIITMPPQISLHELYDMQKQKKHARTLCFDRVVELCHRRIKTVATYGGQNTFYEIPGMMVGYPLFNIYECLNYVVQALRKNGFLVQILPPPHVCVIYVSWDPQELKPPPQKRLAIKPAQPSKAPAKNTPMLRLF